MSACTDKERGGGRSQPGTTEAPGPPVNWTESKQQQLQQKPWVSFIFSSCFILYMNYLIFPTIHWGKEEKLQARKRRLGEVNELVSGHAISFRNSLTHSFPGSQALLTVTVCLRGLFIAPFVSSSQLLGSRSSFSAPLAGGPEPADRVEPLPMEGFSVELPLSLSHELYNYRGSTIFRLG